MSFSCLPKQDGKSRGFGFVKFALAEDAARAASVLDGSAFRSRRLKVELAMKKGERPEGVSPLPKKANPSPSPHPDPEAKEQATDGAAPQPKPKPKPEPKAKTASLATAPCKDVSAVGAEEEPKRGRKKKVAKVQERPRALLVFNVAATTTEKQLYKRVKKTEAPQSIKMEVRCLDPDVDRSSRALA